MSSARFSTGNSSRSRKERMLSRFVLVLPPIPASARNWRKRSGGFGAPPMILRHDPSPCWERCASKRSEKSRRSFSSPPPLPAPPPQLTQSPNPRLMHWGPQLGGRDAARDPLPERHADRATEHDG